MAAAGRLRLPELPPVPVTLYHMAGPHSFTGEDMLEIHLPGSPLLAHRMLEAIVALGADLAGPGEFTRRAFENGRIDLIQAEAIMALIRSRSASEARAALSAVAGEFSAELRAVGRELLDLSGRLEASLDFADRGLGDGLVSQAREALNGLRGKVQALAPVMREEDLPRVLLYGPTNAGKSTLFNALVGEARAVVDPLPGTTRDPVRAMLQIGPVRCELIDPAGTGEAVSGIDAQAQGMTEDELAAADLILLISELGSGVPECSGEFGEQRIMVWTKSDLGQGSTMVDGVIVSAVTGDGMVELCNRITEELGRSIDRSGSRHLLSSRQRIALKEVSEALGEAQVLIGNGEPVEFAAFELSRAREALGRVTGGLLDEDLLGAIFARFCIGK